MDQQEQPRVRLSAAVGGTAAVGVPTAATAMTGAALAGTAVAGVRGSGVPGADAAGTGLPGRDGPGVVPVQRSGPAARYGVEAAGAGGGRTAGGRLRVDARRNLESVLRAAREVFGELGYGAPMEEVARRAGVGVGTVYRRFPSKEVLVRRIASEEVAWLTAQARVALHGDPDPWEALAGYLARAVATGAGRLLPPEAVRHAERLAQESGRLGPGGPGGHGGSDRHGSDGTSEVSRVEAGGADASAGDGFTLVAGPSGARFQAPLAKAPRTGGEPVDARIEAWADADPVVLLDLLGALVHRADAAGELRPGVTVADVVLVLTAAVPAYADPAGGAGGGTVDGQGSPADRLLRILLNGLRAG